MAENRKEWICFECDWIGSPEIPPGECPRCGNPDLTEQDVEGEVSSDGGE